MTIYKNRAEELAKLFGGNGLSTTQQIELVAARLELWYDRNSTTPTHPVSRRQFEALVDEFAAANIDATALANVLRRLKSVFGIGQATREGIDRVLAHHEAREDAITKGSHE